MTTKQTNRRALLTGAALAATATGLTGSVSKAADATAKKVYRTGPKSATPPAYSSGVSFGNLLFLSGVICKTPGDVKAHTEFALGEIKKQLEAAGSSMEKVLRCTAFLADIKDCPLSTKSMWGSSATRLQRAAPSPPPAFPPTRSSRST